MPSIRKNRIEEWVVRNFYKYNIYSVDAGGMNWLTAEPVTPGLVTRCADTKAELKIMLENDVINYLRFQQKVR